MRQSHKMGLMVVMGALILGAFAVSSASAVTPSWKVAGKELKTGEKAALAENITASTHIVFGRATGWKVECLTVSESNANLEGPNLYSAAFLKFGSCSFTAPLSDKEKCAIAGGQFQTSAVSGTLSTVGTTTRLTLTPTNKVEFGELTIKSKVGSCVPAGKFPVTGTMGSEVLSPTVEQASHLLSFTSTSGTALEYAGEPLLFTGQEELTLTSGLKWAA